ncbi:MIP/aquaporin family protein [Planococcus sp. ISL-109]|uniref:MIP/aquaporin family protein n=1 Tax=Planococcus sp. ISL-109 TaxID=2819166 RepID=UPI001BE5AC20|nr:MIP/aquaporin family protein [Planococcus sp. ISL-109]MBT2581551.1 aquaporin family protein [Planococcus sp. ISL-109]
MTVFLAELIGTMVLIIFGAGVVAGVVLKHSKAENSGWIVITIGWGLAVTMGIYAVGSFSGAHLNPAVTLGFAFIGEFPWSQVPMYIAGQLAGAIIGGVIVFFNYLPHWEATEEADKKLGVFSTIPAIRRPLSNLVSEIIGTAVLVMGLLFIGANEFTEGLNPLIVGALIIAIGMSLGGTTGYAINPARDLGPRIAHALLPIPGKGASDWSYAWVPIVGPIFGGIYGAVFYKAMFTGDYSLPFFVMSLALVLVFARAAASVELKKDSVKAEQYKENTIS